MKLNNVIIGVIGILVANVAVAASYEGKWIKPCVNIVNSSGLETATEITFTFKGLNYASGGSSCLYSPAKNNQIDVAVKVPARKVGIMCGAPVWVVPKAGSSNGDYCATSRAYLQVSASGTIDEGQVYEFSAYENLTINSEAMWNFEHKFKGDWTNSVDGAKGHITSENEGLLPFSHTSGVGEVVVDIRKYN